MISPLRNAILPDAAALRKGLLHEKHVHGRTQVYMAREANVPVRALSAFLTERYATLSKEYTERLWNLLNTLQAQTKIVAFPHSAAERAQPEQPVQPQAEIMQNVSSQRAKLIKTLWNVAPEALLPTIELWLPDLDDIDIQAMLIEYRALRHRKD